MSRGKNLRTLHELPIVKGFRPLWIRANYRQSVTLQLEEYEALRLIDYEGLIHEEVAEKMNVSRPTVTRIYEQARKKVAIAIVEGRSFVIEGGDINLVGNHFLCEDCQHKFIVKNVDETTNSCPNCGSTKLLSLSECFVKGCRRCRRCK
jgi:predicted DNA-binding protein (UPF0251 family)